jgi:hypothetical protein
MWEAVTALATLGTGIAIVLTVLLGVRQLRFTGAHLAHLRRATQLEGAMKIFDDSFDHQFIESMRFVTNELPKCMLEPEFRAEVPLIQHGNDAVHKELVVLRYFERVGTYVKNGLIEGPIIYDLIIGRLIEQWEALQEVVKIQRAAKGDGYWENFEFLFNDGVRWLRTEHGDDFLKGLNVLEQTVPATVEASGR